MTHISRGGCISYDYTGQQIHIRQFTDAGSPFPDGRDREYHDEIYIIVYIYVGEDFDKIAHSRSEYIFKGIV